jgi:cell division FtsZ-interacting protein ZapD
MKTRSPLPARIIGMLLRMMRFLGAPELNLARDIDAQVREAAESLRKSSQLVTTLDQNLKERVKKLEHLREEHSRYSQLEQIDAEKAQALLKEIRRSIGQGQAKERWIAFGSNLAAGLLLFVLGVWLSNPLKHFLGIGP